MTDCRLGLGRQAWQEEANGRRPQANGRGGMRRHVGGRNSFEEVLQIFHSWSLIQNASFI